MALPAKFERERLLDEIKGNLRPDGSLDEKAQDIMHIIQDQLDRQQPAATCVLGGSVAKQTYLKDNHDIDFFARFPASVPAGLLSELLEEALSEVVKQYHTKLHRLHGSRDYFQFTVDDITIEVIPVIEIATAYDAQNVTDVSPLHVSWVAKHTAGDDYLCDEIRLAKQFCKAAGIYGAESYISGFSGHVLDILVIHYGSFLKLVSAAAAEWKDRAILDPENHLKDPLQELNDAKVISPLVLVDPVDKNRNAAAALSKEVYDTFKTAAKTFLSTSNPERLRSFFEIKAVTRESIQEELAHLNRTGKHVALLYTWQPLPGKKDIMGAKLLKAHTFLQRAFKEHDFSVVKQGWNFSFSYFLVKDEELPELKELEGPPKQMKKAADEFVNKHGEKAVSLKNERYVAQVKREFRDVTALAKALAIAGYIWEKVADVKLEIIS